MAENNVKYTEENIRSLDWKEHIRMRPGMYIGKLGDGSSSDDGIYVLVKEVVDNSIDEFVMGNGKKISVKIDNDVVQVRDFGRGIPLGKVKDVVSKMNTGGKYDSRAFKKSVGLNGVGTKAVNALSSDFQVESIRDGELKKVSFTRGEVVDDMSLEKTDQDNGTRIVFSPDKDIFKNYKFRDTYLEKMFWNYCYLNRNLTIDFNGNKFISKNGLKDLLESNMDGSPLYPIVHLEGDDIEVAFTHSRGYGEDSDAPPMGVVFQRGNAIYKINKQVLNGNKCYAFTEEVSERLAEEGNEIGIDGSIKIIEDNYTKDSKKHLSDVTKKIIKISGSGKLSDDLTLIAIG